MYSFVSEYNTAMEYHKNNKVLIDFLIKNKRQWSFNDFKSVCLEEFKDSSVNYLRFLKAQLLNGKIGEGSISKYRKSILDLCKIVSQRLEEEKEILERIKNLQEINN